MRKITSKELSLIEDKFMKSLQEEGETKKDTKSMYLCGEVGTGKTYFAKKFKFVEKKVVIKTPHSINKSITLQEIIKSVFINWSGHISDLKSNMNADVKQKMMPNNYLKKIKILIIDDLGAEMVSKWSLNEIFFPLLDYRYEKKLFTIFTSNYSVENLKKLWLKCGIDSVSINRLVSRIKGMCVEYELIGKDRRSM